MAVPKKHRVESAIARFYQRMMGCIPDFQLYPQDNGSWQFWRVDDNGDSESWTSYYHRDGRIEFYGSLRPDEELFCSP